MVSSLTLSLDDAKQDPVVYSAEFTGVFPTKGPQTVIIQECFYYVGLSHSGLKGKGHVRLWQNASSSRYHLMRIQYAQAPPPISDDLSRG